jgi:hypothetical protein
MSYPNQNQIDFCTPRSAEVDFYRLKAKFEGSAGNQKTSLGFEFDASARLPNGRKIKPGPTELPEEFDAEETKANGGKLVAMYLVHCCIYYKLNDSIIDDYLFDELASCLRENWHSVEHVHKHLIDYEMLLGGSSGYYIRFPSIVEGSAKTLLSQVKAGKGAGHTQPQTNPQTEENNMGGTMSQNKGKRGERAVIELLQPVLDELYGAINKSAPILQRNSLQSDQGGFDIAGLSWLAIEVKNCETFQLDKWWEEAKEQAAKQSKHFHVEATPVLMYKRNHVNFRVRMSGYIPCGERKVRTVVDIAVEPFLVWFRERVKQELALLGSVQQ